MQIYALVHNSQTDACSLIRVGTVQPLKNLEYSVLVCFCNSNSVVFHYDLYATCNGFAGNKGAATIPQSSSTCVQDIFTEVAPASIELLL